MPRDTPPPGPPPGTPPPGARTPVPPPSPSPGGAGAVVLRPRASSSRQDGGSDARSQRREDKTVIRGVDGRELSTQASQSKSEDVVVVPDPFPLKPIPPNILTEDDYTDAVSHIIERDFYPDLPHLRIARELLTARALGEPALVQELERKLINLSRPTPLSDNGATPGCVTPGATPMLESALAGSETPAGATPRLSAWERDDDVESLAGAPSEGPSNAQLQLASGKKVVVDLQQVRLDDFHRVFTSEDNAAFEEIVKRDKARLKCKQWWMEDSELRHNTQHKEYREAILNGTEAEKTSALLGNEFKARHALSYPPAGLPQKELEKPKVDFRNTRFTTAQQVELDSALGVAVAARAAQNNLQQEDDAGERMARSGNFGLNAFTAQGTAGMRAVAGRIATPLLPSSEVRGYPMLKTPTLLPGVGGLSPLMTYGQLGSTPRGLDEDGPTFRFTEKTDREQAAEKLQRGATQKVREAKQLTRAERLRALGLTPSRVDTPAGSSRASTGGASARRTPGSASTGGASSRRTPGSSLPKVSPMSPIGAMIQQAQRLAQKGGRLRIEPTPEPTPGSEPPRKRRKKSTSAARAGDSDRLPASITDDLL